MNKKVLIIKGSPRAEGNTATMADIFAKGAIENHNTVTEIVLKDKTIIDCCGCAICQQNGGKCVQDDDMNEIYDEMYKAAATRKEINVQTMIKCFRQYISCFGENGSEEGGIIFAYDTRKTDDVKNMHDILNKVYEMGKNVQLHLIKNEPEKSAQLRLIENEPNK